MMPSSQFEIAHYLDETAPGYRTFSQSAQDAATGIRHHHFQAPKALFSRRNHARWGLFQTHLHRSSFCSFKIHTSCGDEYPFWRNCFEKLARSSTVQQLLNQNGLLRLFIALLDNGTKLIVRCLLSF
jgi:hypothetical protein